MAEQRATVDSRSLVVVDFKMRNLVLFASLLAVVFIHRSNVVHCVLHHDEEEEGKPQHENLLQGETNADVIELD